MAGTVTRTGTIQDRDSVISVTWTYTYPDAYDGTDWDAVPLLDPAGNPIDEHVFDLAGDITVTVTGPGVWHTVFYRQQGQSRNPWREGDLSAANTPVAFPTGSGPNPRLVSDLRGANAWRTS